MIAGARTRTVSSAKDLTDSSWFRADHFLGSTHGMRLTCAYGRDPRRGIATTSSAAAGDTALEVRGAGAQAREGGSAASIRPAAVATTAACGFGAASDVVGRSWAGVDDGRTSTRSTLSGWDADTGAAACSSAGAVNGSSLDESMSLDQVRHH